ncbi:MAG TPA: hypothetical protein VNJ01_18050 [Bacteriovoracaceae bacterium]|nr:hypothetical protein [Bacteriovoracaceae bacterium]
MKSLFIFLIFLLSLSAFAKVESYKCVTKDKLRTELNIEFSKCALTDKGTFDICETDDGKVVIPLNPTNSLLFTLAGGPVELTCQEFNDEVAQPETTPNPMPVPQASRTMRDGPGHGGSNIRGRQ